MSSNSAAWLESAKARPLKVGEAKLHTPAENEIVVEVAAIAINPVDWKLQLYAFMPLNYPYVGGCDVAGTVTAVGSTVQHFAVGDRVTGHAIGLSTQNPQHGGFQKFVAIPEAVAAKIPGSVSFEQASVIPLCLSTAAAGLYGDKYWNLERPVANGRGKGQGTVLIWGGSSSVGCNAIQLAKGSGYEVITTASPKNFDFVKKLGASQVFDYNSSSIVADLVGALKGKTLVATYDSISEKDTTQKLAEVITQSNATKGFIAGVLPVEGPLGGGKVTAEQVFAPTVVHDGIGLDVYRKFLEPALASGEFVPAPPPLVIEQKGLEAIQEGVDAQQKGVSAQKIVVLL